MIMKFIDRLVFSVFFLLCFCSFTLFFFVGGGGGCVCKCKNQLIVEKHVIRNKSFFHFGLFTDIMSNLDQN